MPYMTRLTVCRSGNLPYKHKVDAPRRHFHYKTMRLSFNFAENFALIAIALAILIEILLLNYVTDEMLKESKQSESREEEGAGKEKQTK